MVRIGCGAGFAGDQLAPSTELVLNGNIDFLVLECLAERTIALAQKKKLAKESEGYDPLLERRVRALLGLIVERDVRLVSNFGAANPLAGGKKVIDIADELGIATDVAILLGDDVLDRIDRSAPAWEDDLPLEAHGELLSANAYLGSDALVEALKTDARTVITGRVADPSLFVSCIAHAYDWDLNDLDLVAQATVIGHLLECGPQVSGGYFANPPRRSVPDLAHMGYPIADVGRDATGVITKPPNTGGRVDMETVVEQLLYEVLDPAGYYTPDVIADFTSVSLTPDGLDRVHVSGGRSVGRPETLKVSVGYQAGFRCEAEISYGGEGAVSRARLAGEVVRERLADHVPNLQVDLIGVDSLHGGDQSSGFSPYECRLRVTGMDLSIDVANAVGEEVTALYTSGPAGGGGVRVHTEEVIGILSSTIDRNVVDHEVVHLWSERCK